MVFSFPGLDFTKKEIMLFGCSKALESKPVKLETSCRYIDPFPMTRGSLLRHSWQSKELKDQSKNEKSN